MTRRLVVALVSAVALAACSDSSDLTAPQSPADALLSAGHSGVIPGRFIVTLAPDAKPSAVARDHGVAPDFVYTYVLNGFAGAMSDAARSGLLRDARVTRVEPDGIATTMVTQSPATWGLDRIDQRNLPLDNSYSYQGTGAGVRVYIIDTGILISHGEFEGRAVNGYDFVDNDPVANDCNGHGTHVAGTVGSSTWGVAKGVTLVGVRVLSCTGSGTWSGVIAGMDWVTAQKNAAPAVAAVANMSLGGGANSSVDAAVRRMVSAGVTTAVAAGNGNMGGKEQDACGYSPARVTEALTIGATSSSDTKASWSNYGDCVDFFAPGVSIKSTWINTNYGADMTRTISGTSMATPHVAGAAALYLASNASATAQQVRDALYAATTKNKVTSSKTANNHLLYVDGGAGGGNPVNSPPVASFAFNCTELSCDFTNTSTDADNDGLTSSWTFGDGESSSAASPSHAYAAAGEYLVTLTVNDGNGGSSNTSQTVSVTAAGGGGGGGENPAENSAPSAAFSVACSGGTCSFTDQSTDADGNITSWAWDFGNGQVSSVQNPPSVTYSSPDSYTVTLTVSDAGSLSDSTLRTITCSMRGKSGKMGCQ